MAETSPKRIRPAKIEDLRSTPLFEDVPKKALIKLLSGGGMFICSLRKNQELRLKRGNVECCYVILLGLLKVHLCSDLLGNKKRLFLAWRGPKKGGILGEVKALLKEPGQATLTACENCELLEIPSHQLIQVANETPMVYRNIAQLIIQKTFEDRRRVEVVQMPKGEPQVAQTLLNLIADRGSDPIQYELDGQMVNGMRIRGAIDHEDIAAYYGKTRAAATNHLSALKKARIIDYPGRGRNTIHQYTIIDKEALQKRAQGK